MPNNTKDKVTYCGHHPPYTAVCLFRRQAGRPDKGNCLESGGIRGNMLTRRALQGQPQLIIYAKKILRLVLYL